MAKIIALENQPAVLTLSDIEGKIILTQPVFNWQIEIDISAISAGIYFVLLIDENKSEIVRKVVVAR